MEISAARPAGKMLLRRFFLRNRLHVSNLGITVPLGCSHLYRAICSAGYRNQTHAGVYPAASSASETSPYTCQNTLGSPEAVWKMQPGGKKLVCRGVRCSPAQPEGNTQVCAAGHYGDSGDPAIDQPGWTYSGKVCEAKCKDGYERHGGSQTYVCSKDGKWVVGTKAGPDAGGKKLVCLGKICPDDGVAPHGFAKALHINEKDAKNQQVWPYVEFEKCTDTVKDGALHYSDQCDSDEQCTCTGTCTAGYSSDGEIHGPDVPGITARKFDCNQSASTTFFWSPTDPDASKDHPADALICKAMRCGNVMTYAGMELRPGLAPEHPRLVPSSMSIAGAVPRCGSTISGWDPESRKTGHPDDAGVMRYDKDGERNQCVASCAEGYTADESSQSVQTFTCDPTDSLGPEPELKPAVAMRAANAADESAGRHQKALQRRAQTSDDCSSHSECKTGEYCDDSGSCWECSEVRTDGCYAIDGSCCSAAFLAQCPDNPDGCGIVCSPGSSSPCKSGKHCIYGHCLADPDPHHPWAVAINGSGYPQTDGTYIQSSQQCNGKSVFLRTGNPDEHQSALYQPTGQDFWLTCTYTSNVRDCSNHACGSGSVWSAYPKTPCDDNPAGCADTWQTWNGSQWFNRLQMSVEIAGFTISGAKQSWLDGLYARTNLTCHSSPVYQHGGNVLKRLSSHAWMVGSAEQPNETICSNRGYLDNQHAKTGPDAAEAAGKWDESCQKQNKKWCPNSALEVHSSEVHSPEVCYKVLPRARVDCSGGKNITEAQCITKSLLGKPLQCCYDKVPERGPGLEPKPPACFYSDQFNPIIPPGPEPEPEPEPGFPDCVAPQIFRALNISKAWNESDYLMSICSLLPLDTSTCAPAEMVSVRAVQDEIDEICFRGGIFPVGFTISGSHATFSSDQFCGGECHEAVRDGTKWLNETFNYAFVADIGFEECADKCAELHCSCFDFRPGSSSDKPAALSNASAQCRVCGRDKAHVPLHVSNQGCFAVIVQPSHPQPEPQPDPGLRCPEGDSACDGCWHGPGNCDHSSASQDRCQDAGGRWCRDTTSGFGGGSLTCDIINCKSDVFEHISDGSHNVNNVNRSTWDKSCLQSMPGSQYLRECFVSCNTGYTASTPKTTDIKPYTCQAVEAQASLSKPSPFVHGDKRFETYGQWSFEHGDSSFTKDECKTQPCLDTQLKCEAVVCPVLGYPRYTKGSRDDADTPNIAAYSHGRPLKELKKAYGTAAGLPRCTWSKSFSPDNQQYQRFMDRCEMECLDGFYPEVDSQAPKPDERSVTYMCSEPADDSGIGVWCPGPQCAGRTNQTQADNKTLVCKEGKLSPHNSSLLLGADLKTNKGSKVDALAQPWPTPGASSNKIIEPGGPGLGNGLDGTKPAKPSPFLGWRFGKGSEGNTGPKYLFLIQASDDHGNPRDYRNLKGETRADYVVVQIGEHILLLMCCCNVFS